MDEKVKQALTTDRTIDITTIGRTSGQPRRIEIWFHHVEGRWFITGLPGKRDWYANLAAHPEFTFHLKESVKADLPATARAIVTEAERREVLAKILNNLGRQQDLELWVKDSPLIEINFHS